MSEYPAPTTVPIFNEVNYPTEIPFRVEGSVTLNTPVVEGCSWSAVGNVHTLTQNECKYLTLDGTVGELTVYASNSDGSILGAYKVTIKKVPGVDFYLTLGTLNKTTTLTTFTVANSGSNLVVTTSPNCKICWLFIGV